MFVHIQIEIRDIKVHLQLEFLKLILSVNKMNKKFKIRMPKTLISFPKSEAMLGKKKATVNYN